MWTCHLITTFPVPSSSSNSHSPGGLPPPGVSNPIFGFRRWLWLFWWQEGFLPVLWLSNHKAPICPREQGFMGCKGSLWWGACTPSYKLTHSMSSNIEVTPLVRESALKCRLVRVLPRWLPSPFLTGHEDEAWDEGRLPQGREADAH